MRLYLDIATYVVYVISNAGSLQSAGLYGATFLISVVLLIKEKVKRKDSLDESYAGFGEDGKAGLVSNRSGAYGYGSQY